MFRRFLKLRVSSVLLLLCATFCIPHLSATPPDPKINWYTEDYPPFNYHQTGSTKGIAVNILLKAYAQLNWQLQAEDIRIMPWTRAYYTLKSEENACLFSMTYTPERAKVFNFLGTVMPNTVAIIGHADSTVDEIQLKTDLNLRFGVVKNDIGHQTLMEFGIPDSQFVFLKTGYELVQMLEHKRVDFIAYGEVIARYQLERANISENQFKVVKPLLKSLLGFACNPQVSSDVINALDNAIHNIVKEHPEIIQY
ncbi:substrate-binding periplasmic protein [Pseudoalteromonas sp.]|uniref:substrate-binding periplasmic protein n=1 Tax=Pseudoalteromonas sp. TaxID=53249 RepID=UPI0035684FA5